MKKAATLLTVMILCLSLLAGCSCRHEWTDATCTAPRICALCGETEGEALGHTWAEATCEAPKTCTACGETEGGALGHSWQDATCEAPETCSRCAKTEGEALGHTYGQWDFGETEMTRTCTVCAGTETTGIDWEIWLRQTLEGSWDLLMEVQDNYITFEQSIDGFRPLSLRFHGDNQGYWYIGTEAVAVTWRAKNSDANPDLLAASLKADDQSVSTTIYVDPKEETVYLFTGEAEYLVFSRHRSLTQALTGSWACTEFGFENLQLSADRTFTGSFQRYNRDIKEYVYEDISGIWHVSPEYDYGGLTFCDVCLCLNGDGENYVTTVYLGDGQSYSSDSLQHEQLEMTLKMDNISRSFEAMDDEAYAELEHATRNLPCGPWTSTEVSKGDDSRETDAYSINFAEDGTFTAVLDTQRSGTWYFDSFMHGVNGENKFVTGYHYRLLFDGLSEPVSFFIYKDEDHGGTYLSSNGRYVHFLQMTEEKIAEREAIRAEAAERIAGSWSALEMHTWFSNDSGNQTKNMLDYNITFAADGTFTATLDQAYTGTWTYERTRVETWDPDFPQTYHTYELCFDGIPDSIEVSIRVSCYEDSPDTSQVIDYPDAFVAREADGCLEVNHTAQDGTRYYLTFYRLSEETLEEIRAEREALIGTWRRPFVTIHSFVTGKRKQLPTGDYTMQVFADGTFIAQLDQTISGYWYYRHGEEYLGEYVFYTSSDDGTVTGIDNSGYFRLYLIFGDAEYTAEFKKD